jgi:hypothetical protein
VPVRADQLSFGLRFSESGSSRRQSHCALRPVAAWPARLNGLVCSARPRGNAPRISDLKRMFPPQSGRFIVGPMAKLGGARRRLYADIGLILRSAVGLCNSAFRLPCRRRTSHPRPSGQFLGSSASSAGSPTDASCSISPACLHAHRRHGAAHYWSEMPIS